MASWHGLVARVQRRYLERRLRGASVVHPSAYFLQTAAIINNKRPDAIEIGEASVIGGELLVYPDGGRIRIGSHCFIGGDTRIWSGSDISIGNRVLISHGVNIHDANSHSLSAHERHDHFIEILVKRNGALGRVPKAPIVVEDDAWIGFNASVFKGVRIGRGAVIASGSIVTRNVPPFTIVAGAPAVSIGQSLE